MKYSDYVEKYLKDMLSFEQVLKNIKEAKDDFDNNLCNINQLCTN